MGLGSRLAFVLELLFLASVSISVSVRVRVRVRVAHNGVHVACGVHVGCTCMWWRGARLVEETRHIVVHLVEHARLEIDQQRAPVAHTRSVVEAHSPRAWAGCTAAAAEAAHGIYCSSSAW